MVSHKKIDRLTPTDLARVATLPLDKKYRALSSTKSGFPPFNYNPVRASFPDILNIVSGFLLEIERPSWPSVRKRIRAACRRSTAERIANVQVGNGLYLYSTEKKIAGQRHDFRQLTIADHQVVYWTNVVIRIDGKSYVPFFDPRRTKGLTHDAMRFVFSVMHEHIRAVDPDFKDVGFVIFRFADTTRGPRRPVPFFDNDFELYDYETLSRMVKETYDTLAKVFSDREAKKKAS